MAAGRFDALVVGAGVAGCAVANRLAEGGRRVLLIEAGPGEPRPASSAGIDIVAAADEATRLWPDSHVRRTPDSSPYPYRQGRGLGGGSLVNALLLSPGDRADYDRWVDLHGCDGWGAADMDPWLDAALRRFRPGHVVAGPVTAAFEEAAVAAGHPVGGSSIDQDRSGLMAAALAMADGHRLAAPDAYPLPARGAMGVAGGSAVRTDATVDRILVDGDAAVGVELTGGEQVAAPLVVACAGAIRSPLLLLRSGLTGRPVGRRLQDHPSFVFTLVLDPRAFGRRPEPETVRAVSRLLRWRSGADGAIDLQAFIIDRVGDGADGRPLGVAVVGLTRVSSLGSVTAAAGGDGHRPDVVTGSLVTADDRRRLRAGVHQVRELLAAPAIEALVDDVHIDDRGTPVGHLDRLDGAGLDAWIASHPGPYAHPGGSCPLGPASSPRAVVSSEPGERGRLHGYRGIWVADASVHPDLVSGGLQIPTAAVAERIATDLGASNAG